MNLGFDAAAKGTPEMAFWPTAASLLIYSHSPSELSLISTVVLMFAGSMTHLSMRQMKKLMERISERTSTRQGVKRDNKSVSMVKRVTDASKVTRNILPNNPYVLIFTVTCAL
ncbi:hypothetical protein [Halomicrococcus sp. SG-WS-1]|uniref:hypothetical protein n=1 Tax=Halomicrococcus sp. SG-WS-1 TaxID=3439057 RepID=UPI003F79C6E6